MKAHLYAVEFGAGGQIKVGRSVDAPARIGTHVRAAIAAGSTVTRLCVEPCAAPVPAEAKLVEVCAAAATSRVGRELFGGLRFEDVSGWVRRCANADYPATETAVHKAMRVLGGSPASMAAALGTPIKRQNVEQWLKAGRVPAGHAPIVEAATRLAGAPVHCEQRCPGVRWDVVRSNSVQEPA